MLEEKQKKIVQKLKNMFLIKKENTEEETDNKRKIENLVTFIVILIITVIVINIIWNGGKFKKENKAIAEKTLAKEESMEVREKDTRNAKCKPRTKARGHSAKY